MSRIEQKLAGVTMFIAIACQAGCGSGGVKLAQLNGKVTFAGQPLKFGQIDLIPNAAVDHKGPAGGAEVVDGVYSTSLAGGNGFTPGPHLVRITGYEERPQGSEDETQTIQQKPPLFVGYTIEVTLEAGTKDFDVPESARGFDLMKPSNTKSRRNDP
ncbi:MAG: hypothetical protein SFV23_15870 [Planctomycetaceae bacterium]|nr:hypothetical protein [Planctomycetaceae bacterium]